MKISVLQWNIWFKEDIHNVTNFLMQHPADIVCLQELTIGQADQSVDNTPEFIAQQLGYNFYYKDIPIESTDGRRFTIANGIFTRFPITNQRFVWINETKGAGGYDDEYRAYVEITVDTGARKLSIGTTHSSYTHRFKPTAGKQSETDRLVGELRKHERGLIFAGDLNALPDSYTIDAISKVLQNAGPDLSEKTWTTKPFSYNGFEEAKLNWRLDYVFASSDLKPLSAEVLQTDFSDHLPILAKFEL